MPGAYSGGSDTFKAEVVEAASWMPTMDATAMRVVGLTLTVTLPWLYVSMSWVLECQTLAYKAHMVARAVVLLLPARMRVSHEPLVCRCGAVKAKA